MASPVLEVRNLKKFYEIPKGWFKKPDVLRAANGVSFQVLPGETIGIVGESGCGKSTIGKLILKIEEPTDGQLFFRGEDVTHLPEAKLKSYWRNVQIIFQDPYASLNPRWKVGDIISEPLRLHGIDDPKQERVLGLMAKVGLDAGNLQRYPHQFSGGQRQRICIARALALQPEVIICDEPVSALDVSIQSQALNLLLDLQKEFKLTYVFISHDLSVVEHISDRVAVMYLGKIVETAATEDLFANPRHPYTRALLDAVPDPEITEKRERKLLQGELPSPVDPPSGCAFRTRCPVVKDECQSVSMDLVEVKPGHQTACPFF